MPKCTRNLSVFLLTAMFGLGASAQLTLEERIKQAQDAKKAVPTAIESKLSSATPTVQISVDQARNFPAFAPGSLPAPQRLALVTLSGFPDDLQRVEATIAVNVQNHNVTLAQPRFADGWELVALTFEAVELMRDGKRYTLRLSPLMQAPVTPGASAARQGPAQIQQGPVPARSGGSVSPGGAPGGFAPSGFPNASTSRPNSAPR